MNSNSNAGQFQDQTITCRDCQGTFVFEAGEAAFFAERQFSTPTRCKPCRQARKAQQAQQGAVAGPPGMAAPVQARGVPVAPEGEQPRRPSSKGRGGNKRYGREDD